MRKLTARDLEVLTELEAANRHLAQYGRYWATPLDCGGSNGSDHSYRLSKMSDLGLVQSKQRHGEVPLEGENGKKRWRGRGSKEYRITEAGRQAPASPAEGGSK